MCVLLLQEMEEHFLQYGEITDCYITPPRYRDQQFAGSARTANLCYVTFKHPDALTAALKAVADATGENGYGADRSFRKYQINGHDIGRIIEARPHPKAQKHQQEEVEQAESQPTQLTANPQAAGAIAGLWMAQQLMGFSGTASGQVADTTAEEGGRTSGGRNADDTPGSKQAQSSKRPASASDSSVHAAKRHMQQAYWTRQPGAAQPAVGRYGATSQQSSYQVTEQSTPWQAAVDPASGHTYYVNSQTGQSSWYPPPELGAVQHTASHFSPHQGGGLAVRAAQPASQGTTNAALVPRTGATRSAFASGPVPPSVPLHPSASAGAGPAVFMPQAAVVHRNERTSAAGGALAAAAAVAPSAATESATLVALRAELGGLRLSVLQQRAGLAGLPRTEIMEAVDSENPKRAVLLLLLRHAAAAEAAARTQAEVRAAATASSTAMLEAVQQAQQETARRACRVADQHTAHVELKAVEQKLKSQERDENKAAALDVAVKTAFDETVKQAMAEKAPFLEGLEAKLSAQKLSALQERARKSGADAAALKAANQNDPSNPKRALIQLIMEQAKLYFLKGAREAAQKAEPAIRVAAQKQVELAFAELKVKQEQEAKEAMAPALVQKLRVEGRLPERIQYQ